MAKTRLVVLASFGLASAACGGGTGSAPNPPPAHPNLDQDYSAPFVGTWRGSGDIATADGIEARPGDLEIARIGYNRLAIRRLCPGTDGEVGVDKPTAFSLDPFTCPAPTESCGTMTHSYRGGTGDIDPLRRTIGITFWGKAEGCGLAYDFTFAFIGTDVDVLALPVAVVVPASGVTAPGIPIAFDATGSADPEGWALRFAWSVESQPEGAAASLDGADTATATFTSSVPGAYRLLLVVTAPDREVAMTTVPVLVRPALATQSYVYLVGEDFDPVVGGRGYFYTMADAALLVTADGGHLGVGVTGDQRWTGDFAAAGAPARLEPGMYDVLGRYSASDPVLGGLAWFGDQRSCAALTGWFAIDDVMYSGAALTAIDLRFEQHCDGAQPALRGIVHWRADDTTRPPGPVYPTPVELWAPPPGSTPETGSYAYLESDPGDEVGEGGIYLYDQRIALFDVAASGGRLDVGITGDQVWSGTFQAMSSLGALEPGYYGDLMEYPVDNPARGGLTWASAFGGCPVGLTGWFAVDEVTYSGSTLTAIELRFEQHCGGQPPALRGKIHWDAADPTRLGPIDPPPQTLWRAPSGSTPSSGSYVYLQSDAGDFVGLGRTYLYTQADAVLWFRTTDDPTYGSQLEMGVGGDEYWSGGFQTMVGLSRLEPGLYEWLQRWQFHSGTRGGFIWHGEGRGCNNAISWVVIDAATYAGTALTGLDLRFEQHCEWFAEALHGQIHWDASDATQPPGPVNPPPAGLWDAPPGSTPDGCSYVYVESQPAGSVAATQRWVYTQADAVLRFVPTAGGVDVSVTGDEWWGGSFRAMSPLAELQPGYYGDLHPWPFNPARGGVNWYGGPGDSCDGAGTWFAVDGVTYDGGTLTGLDIRFEEPCDVAETLRGRIHWYAGDPTAPPGPLSPPPEGLWRAPAGSTPTTGSYVYLESEPGEYLGEGRIETFTRTNADLGFTGTGVEADVSISQGGNWIEGGKFTGMSSLARLEPGYYGSLKDEQWYNPTQGTLRWTERPLRECSGTGWFVVDAVTYSGTALTGLDLRFEHRCLDLQPALRGQIHWSAGE